MSDQDSPEIDFGQPGHSPDLDDPDNAEEESENNESSKEEAEARELEKEFNGIFTKPKAAEEFVKCLLGAGEGKFTKLAKAIESVVLIKEERSKREERALNIIKAVLILTNSTMSSEGVEDLCGCLYTESKHFSNKVLANAITFCIKYLKEHVNDDISSRWVEVFGRLVSGLSIRNDIEYDGDVLEGHEFRTEIVEELCRLQWGPKNAPYLIAAMKEFPGLNNTDINNIIVKISEAMKELDPTSVPPIAYQILLLAASRRPQCLLQTFDNYFKGIVFDTNETDASLSNENKSKKAALGTVVYHFVHAARHHPAVIKEIMKRIKHSCDDHGLLMTPFILCVTIGLTSIEHINSQVVEALRRSILNSLQDCHNGDLSAWYKSARGEKVDTVMQCFKAIIESRSSELDFMLDGLKDLGLMLLNVDEVQTDGHFSTDKCRDVGSFIIKTLVKKKEHYFPKVMNELLKTKSSAHVDCLASCITSLIRKIVSTSLSGRISELIHHLPMMTVETATPIIKALLPAFHLSKSLLDEMIIVVRKTIWKSVEARKISVQAMVLLLSNSRVVGDIQWSQYSESQTNHSQLNSSPVYDLMGGSNKNECLCSELLCILKRSFTQHREVRERLYLGLHTVSRRNPALLGPIVSNIVGQVRQHMDDSGTEISMEKLLDFSNSGNMVIAEELGLLLQCLSFLTLKGRSMFREDAENQPESLVVSETTLDIWINSMKEMNFIIIDSEATAMMRKSQPRPVDSSKTVKSALLLQMLQTLQALIEYVALRDKLGDEQLLRDLFAKYVELRVELERLQPEKKKKENDKSGGKKTRAPAKDKDKKAKAPPKKANNTTNKTPAKKGTKATKKKPNNNNTTVGTQDTQGGSKTKLKSEPEQTFELIHIITLDSLLIFFKKLYNTDEEESVYQLVRTDFKFEKFLLSILKQKMERLKNGEFLKERDRHDNQRMNTLASISGVLWEASHKKAMSDSATESAAAPMDMDDSEDVLIVDSDSMLVDTFRFQIILELVELLFDQNEQTLSRIDFIKMFTSEVFNDKTFEDMLATFFDIWSSIVDKWTEVGRDIKGLEHLFVILNVFCHNLNSHSTEIDPENPHISSKIYQWLLNYARTEEGKADPPTLEITGVVMQAILTIGSKFTGNERDFDDIAKNCLMRLGDVDDDDEESTAPNVLNEYWLIIEDTAPAVICCFGKCIRSNLDLVNLIIKRLKAQSLYFPIDKLDELRDKVCTRLSFLIELCTVLIRSNFPSGPCVDVLQEVMPQVFITTTLLTEYHIDILPSNSNKNDKPNWKARKFQSLVKLIGSDFKARVEGLITHIENVQRVAAQNEAEKGGGKVPMAMKLKFMKDARTIPTLVYNVEKYEQQLILLSQKVKVNLLAGTKLSTARDFRIESGKVIEAIASKDANKPKKKKRKAQDTTQDTQSSSDDDESSSMQQAALSRLANTTSRRVSGLSSKKRRS